MSLWPMHNVHVRRIISYFKLATRFLFATNSLAMMIILQHSHAGNVLSRTLTCFAAAYAENLSVKCYLDHQSSDMVLAWVHVFLL